MILTVFWSFGDVLHLLVVNGVILNQRLYVVKPLSNPSTAKMGLTQMTRVLRSQIGIMARSFKCYADEEV